MPMQYLRKQEREAAGQPARPPPNVFTADQIQLFDEVVAALEGGSSGESCTLDLLALTWLP